MRLRPRRDPNSWNPFRSNKWIDTLFEKAMSNPITALLWTVISMAMIFGGIFYIWADIRHWTHGTPEPTFEKVFEVGKKMISFEDSGDFVRPAPAKEKD